MAERDDEQLGERYRALGREEPPAEIDASILAASRRAAQSRRRRWVLPLSIAAVIVLSVSVTLQLQHERADLAGRIEAPAEAGKAAAPAAPAAADNVMRPPALERKMEESPAAPAAQPERRLRQSAEASPEQWLARIAELRRQGRDDEAERQLAEFRRRFPDYRIPQAMRDKVEPR